MVALFSTMTAPFYIPTNNDTCYFLSFFPLIIATLVGSAQTLLLSEVLMWAFTNTYKTVRIAC